MSLLRLFPLLPLVAAIADTRFQVDDPGTFGRRRLERLAEVPDDLARLPRDEQEAWSLRAGSRIAATARSEGWLDVRAVVRIVQSDSSANDATVVLDFSPGRPYRFGAIEWRFPSDSGPGRPAEDRLPARVGSPYNQERLDDLLSATTGHFLRRGWLDASVVPEIRPDTATATVQATLSVEPGRPAVLSRLEIEFEDRHLTQTDILRDLWKPTRGDTIGPDDLSGYTRKIYRTRLFGTVRMERLPDPRDSASTLLRLRLKERTPGSVEGILAWEPTFGWALEGIARHRNVAGSMNELSLSGRVSEKDQKLRAGHGLPLLLGTPVSLDQGLSVRQQSAGLVDTTVFREVTYGADGTFTLPATDWSTISLSLAAERVTKNPWEGSPKTLYQYTTILGAGLDFRDEPFDPISGWTLAGTVGNGGRFDFDTTFTWVQARSKVWTPLFWRLLSAAALDGGRFLNSTTLDGAGVFWQGGGRSVRSFRYNELRVSPPPGSPLRPRYLRASLETRLNLPSNLQAVWFNDWARLWNEGQPMALTDLSRAHVGYGTGIRWRISLLSLRLDYAFGRGDERWTFDLAQAI